MKDWYHIFQIVWTIGSAVVGWGLWRQARRQKKEKDRSEEIEALHKDHHRFKSDVRKHLGDIERRHDGLRRDINNMPTHQDIKDLTEKIERTNRQLSDVVGEFRAINRTVSLINEYFINRGESK